MLCLHLTEEDKCTFIQFYSLLKNEYNFNPKKLTCEFSKANIKAIKKVYGEGKILIITCFFHLTHIFGGEAIN